MLGDVLESRGHAFDAVAVGGSALLLLGYVRRATRDPTSSRSLSRAGLFP
jgi:hypothetical protein